MRRSEALRELNRRAREGAVRMHDLPPRVRSFVLREWGSIAEARRAANLRPPTSNRLRWTATRVVEEVQALHEAGQHMSQSAVIGAGRKDLVLAADKHFGSWSAARAHAGLPPLERRPSRSETRWDQDTITAEIRRRRRRKDSLAVTKAPRSLVAAAFRHFGSWRAAVEGAGYDYNSIALSRRFEDDELLGWLRKLRRVDPGMTIAELDDVGTHAAACKRRWGSLEAAARAAGLEGWPIRTKHSGWTRAQVIDALRVRAGEKRALNLAAVRSDPANGPLLHGAYRHFDSWDDAIIAAGLHPQRLRRK